MNDALTGKTSKSEHGTDWDKLQRLTPADIRAAIDDDPDAHPTDPAFWQTAKIVMPCPKATITIRIDKDVLDWLKQQGRGYQTRINAILRAYMDAQQRT